MDSLSEGCTSPIRARLSSLRSDDIVTCAIVRSELLHGAQKYGNRSRRVALVNQTLAPFLSVPFDDDAANEYARVRHELEVSGSVIGPYDLQIAAICLCHTFIRVTNNISEFSRVAGLQLEDWLSAPTSS